MQNFDSEFDENIYNFMQKYDMIHEKLPKEWLLGIPIANGEIGTMIWGEKNVLHFTLDNYNAWECREQKPDFEQYNYQNLKELILSKKFTEAKNIFQNDIVDVNQIHPTRLPLPRFDLKFKDPIIEFKSRLSLYKATVYIELKTKSPSNSNISIFNIEIIVHAFKNIIQINISEKSGNIESSIKILPTSIDFEISDSHFNEVKKNTTFNQKPVREILNNFNYPEPNKFSENGTNFYWQEIFEQGGYLIGADSTKSKDSKNSQMMIRIGVEAVSKLNNTQTSKEILESLKKLISKNMAELKVLGNSEIKKSHMTFWAPFWAKSFISIPDSRLENLYYLELYKLACCSREGKLPCTLQGLWTRDGGMPPWSGDYHLDMNVQETYWPTYSTNHLELARPLNDMIWNCKDKYEKNCQQFFGFDGIHSGCAIGPRGERVYGYYTVEYWPGNVAWISHNLWLYWKYSSDKEFLSKKVVPIMEKALNTYSQLLEEDHDGYLSLPLGFSPEYYECGSKAWGRNSTCDIALIRFLATALIESYKILEIDNVKEDKISEFEELLEELDYPADISGFQIFEGESLQFSHRHFSHLMAIHPLGLVTPEGEQEDQFLIENSLRHIRKMGTGLWTGWSWPWMSLIASRAGYSQMAWKMLQDYFYFIKPNGFHINGDPRKSGVSEFSYNPMTLEAGFCSVAAVTELLLQSWNGIIRVFPTIPEFWRDSWFRCLRTEGAFLVESSLKNRRVEFIKITSEIGNPCKVLNPGYETPILLVLGKNENADSVKHHEFKVEGKIIYFKTEAKTDYLLVSNLENIKLYFKQKEKIQEIKKDRKIENWFG